MTAGPRTTAATTRTRAPSVSGGPIVQLPTAFGKFVAQAWTDLETGAEHLAVSSPKSAQWRQSPPGAAALGVPHG